MTLATLKTLLETTGYPVAYDHFSSKQTIPFIAYKTAGTDNIASDQKVMVKMSNVQVELYTDIKDLTAEANLETILDNNNIEWDTIETFITEEEMYQRIYEIKIRERG